jgi:hypothetical protein
MDSGPAAREIHSGLSLSDGALLMPAPTNQISSLSRGGLLSSTEDHLQK